VNGLAEQMRHWHSNSPASTRSDRLRRLDESADELKTVFNGDGITHLIVHPERRLMTRDRAGSQSYERGDLQGLL
jgi:hypothetical protein